MKHLSEMALVASMCLLAAYPSAATDFHAPRLICEQPTFDFGVRDKADVVTHEFVIGNAGDAPLQIRKVKSSCGCTVASLSTNVVLPGAQAAVVACFTLRGRRGEQYKLLTVDSNDPERPRFLLSLRGTVTTELGMDPAYLNFGIIDDKTPTSREARLIGETRDADIVSARVSSAAYTVEVVPDETGRKHRIRVTTVPPLSQGYTRATITIETTDPKRPTLQLAVGGSVAGDVAVVPRSLMIKGQAGDRVSRSIYLRYKPDHVPDVEAVEVPEANMRTRVQKPGAQMQRIDVYDIPVDKTLDGSTIKIRIDGAPILHVPIRVQGP